MLKIYNRINSPRLPSSTSNRDRKHCFLPAIRPSSRHSSVDQNTPHRRDSLRSTATPNLGRTSARLHIQRPPLTINDNETSATSSSTRSSIAASISNLSNVEYFSKVSAQQRTYSSESSDESSEIQSSNDTDDEPDVDINTFHRDQHTAASTSTRTSSYHHGCQNEVECVTEEESIIFTRSTSDLTGHQNTTPSSVIGNSTLPTVHLRSLFQSHYITINNSTTVQDLIETVWREVKFDTQNCTRNSHVLLLFNQRLHIFVKSDPTTLITNFLSLSPRSNPPKKDSIDFYLYWLPRDRATSMYKIDHGHASLFGNPESWYPVHFINHKQLDRPQSILLSSLYALRLYFRTDIQELKAERLAMEAQFFLHLRAYLFPPAILALKHAIVGSMFYFEKPLLMDALIQLLIRLCDPDKIFPNEVCDFIPLVFCWLLNMCDPNDEKEDNFLEVQLVNSKTGKDYFHDPVTTSKGKRRALTLEEFNGKHDHNFLQHHVDIRSLTLHLEKHKNISSDFAYDEYVVYDPTTCDSSVVPALQYWTDANITELYANMAQTADYRSFLIITRGAITADTKNQLVLLHEGRTVALLLTQKHMRSSSEKTRQDMDHFFQIFDPLMCTKEKSQILVTSSMILNENQELPDPRLPIHLNNNLLTNTADNDSFLHNDSTNPAHQVTVILLDLSRSMSSYRIMSSATAQSATHIDICKIMLGRLSDNILAASETHAFGLIQFATNFKTICPITRKREQFDKALSFGDCNGQWTSIYDAIGEAVRQIKTFVDSPKRARKDCKKLIIVLSDGINNYGKTKFEKLNNLTKKNKIVIDFISFVRDDQLKKEETSMVRQFRKLCTDSGGYVYQNLCKQSDLELAAIFEQEAAVWLSKRSRTSHGIIDKPERYVPPTFQEKACRDPGMTEKSTTSSFLRRILNESEAILNRPPENIFVFVVRENIAFWKVILKGPQNTPYQNRFWMLYVEFDCNYPKCPPNVRFFTPIFHVNISGDGKICHQILHRSWCQQTKMKEIFENILDLLGKPNFDDAVSLEKAHLYKEDPNEYRRQARNHSDKYASDDLEALKLKHQLEDYDEQFDEDTE